MTRPANDFLNQHPESSHWNTTYKYSIVHCSAWKWGIHPQMTILRSGNIIFLTTRAFPTFCFLLSMNYIIGSREELSKTMVNPSNSWGHHPIPIQCSDDRVQPWPAPLATSARGDVPQGAWWAWLGFEHLWTCSKKATKTKSYGWNSVEEITFPNFGKFGLDSWLQLEGW